MPLAVLCSSCETTRRDGFIGCYDFTKSQIITPGQYYCVSGKVNSADKLYLVIESVKPDTKHARAFHVSCSR